VKGHVLCSKVVNFRMFRLLIILKACCSLCADSDIFNLLVLSWPFFMEATQKNFLKGDVGKSKVSSQYKLFLPQFEFSKIYPW